MKYSVIVAEDEELLLNNLVQKIEHVDSDFQVVGTAQTGAQAYTLIEKLNPEVLITDIRMPVMDGIALIAKVREHFPLIKCIITSGFSDFEYARSAITLSVSDYLLKPIDSEELGGVLDKIKREFQIAQNSFEGIFSPETTRQTPAQIAELLKEYILSNYTSEINLNLIASSMNYSSSYLTKIFCQVYDCTPSKYIINLRINKSCQLLLHNPELSIRQIGEAVGYLSLIHISEPTSH